MAEIAKIQLPVVQTFLNQKFEKVFSVKHMADGWWSSAFYFKSSGKAFVIRFSDHPRDFKKDGLAFKQFNSQQIRIPKILEIGNYDHETSYCISEYISGKTSDHVMRTVGVKEKKALSTRIIDQLLKIHQVDVSALNGWGYIDQDGEGTFDSWQEFLQSFYNSKQNVPWQVLSEESWLNGELFEHLIKKMSDLFSYLPLDKHLLHGDFGFDNLLIGANKQVTAVLDWAEMMLGDPVYDLIHLNEPWMENTGTDYLNIWKVLNKSTELEKNLQERLQCYRIHYTLFHMHIHTVRGEEEDYKRIECWARNNL